MLKAIVNSPVRSGDQTIVNGDLIVGTAGEGINFTANTPAAGMTSQLLNWYEEGTWTPTLSAFSGTITTVGTCVGRYTRIGRQVTLSIDAAITTNGTGSVVVKVSNLPFNGELNYFFTGSGEDRKTGKSLVVDYIYNGSTNLYLSFYDGTYPGSDGARFIVSLTYNV